MKKNRRNKKIFLAIRIWSVFAALYSILIIVLLVDVIIRNEFHPAILIWVPLPFIAVAGIRASKVGAIGVIPYALLSSCAVFLAKDGKTLMTSIGPQVLFTAYGLLGLAGAVECLVNWKSIKIW